MVNNIQWVSNYYFHVVDNDMQSFLIFIGVCIIKLQILDTRDLKISTVGDGKGTELKYTVGDPVKSFGSKLEIQLPNNPSKQ